MPEFSTRKPIVLVVEDDPHGLSFLESSLEISGYQVLKATTAEEGFEIYRENASLNIVSILSDYRLPGANGLELLRWIREQDSALAFILITGQGEKSIVQQAMKLGAFAYLEKPLTHQQLRTSMAEASSETHKERQSIIDRKGLEDLEQFDMHIRGIVPEGMQEHLRILYKPLHEVGGDFFITHRFSPEEFVLVIGDVSGHDITSGFVSIYFQGLFRGCTESSSRVQDFLSLSNRTLYGRDVARLQYSQMVSLSTSAFYINRKTETLCHWNFGLPPCYAVTLQGRIIECPFGKPPLGWLKDIELDTFHIPVKEVSHLLVFTDGVLEYASDIGVNSLSLLHRLMTDQNVINSLPNEPKDDILAFEYTINPQIPLHPNYQPLLSEHYAGTEVDHIDHLQANWRRSLTFALEDRMGDRLYDLLICIREGMLNALIHGCQKAPDKFAHLQISLSEDEKSLRIVIDDPGRGHEFDLKKRLEEIRGHTGKHLGLGIIQHLSDDFYIENKGTSLIFDFEIDPVHA